MTSRLTGVAALLLLVIFHGIAFGLVRRRLAQHGDGVELSGGGISDIVSDGLYLLWAGADVIVCVLVVIGVTSIGRNQVPQLALVCALGAIVLLATAMAAWSEQMIANARHVTPAGSPAGLLLTEGPFGLVRHPISVAVGALSICLAALVPNDVTAIAAIACIVGRQLHVRRVSEPRLRARFGPQYQFYAQNTGRFFPFVGRAKAVGEGNMEETVTPDMKPTPDVPAAAIELDDDGQTLTPEELATPMPPPNPKDLVEPPAGG